MRIKLLLIACIHVSHQVCGEFAFVHNLYLVSLEDEGVVVAAPLAPVQSENGSRSVPPDLGRVPLTVVNVDGSQPDLHLFSPERVEVVPEPKQVWSISKFSSVHLFTLDYALEPNEAEINNVLVSM